MCLFDLFEHLAVIIYGGFRPIDLIIHSYVVYTAFDVTPEPVFCIRFNVGCLGQRVHLRRYRTPASRTFWSLLLLPAHG